MFINNTKIFKSSLVLALLFLMQQISFGQEWEKMNNSNFTRNHGIGFSINGLGYVLTGGSSESYDLNFHSQDFHRYDPVTDSWEQLEYDGPSRGYGIGAVWDDVLYFGFGLDENFSALNDFWSWDPETNEFTELPTCPCIGRTHPAFVTVDNKVYVGMGGNGGNLGDWWQYDIATQEWTQKSDMPGKRHHPYMFVIGEDIYVGSGHRTTWFKYDAINDNWIQISDLDDRVAGTQFAYEGRGYALSGTDNFHDNLATGEFWQYIPEVDSWVELEPHPGGSRWAPASFIIDNYVYIVSGWATVASEEVEVYRYKLGEAPVGLEDIDILERAPFEIYPNPATEYISIDFNMDIEKYSDMKIYDVSGKLVYESQNAVELIQVDQLSSGTYWLQIRIDGKRIKRPFIKK